jgi:hypothetical protein
MTMINAANLTASVQQFVLAQHLTIFALLAMQLLPQR